MKGEVGIWISGSMYQLRVRTQAYPQPIIVLPQELVGALWNHTAPPEVYTDLQPGGDIHLDLGMSTLVDAFPQKMAWNRIISQIARLFVNRCLDETSSPELLQERCTGYLAHPFGKSRCKKERVCLHWLQMDVQRGYHVRM